MLLAAYKVGVLPSTRFTFRPNLYRHLLVKEPSTRPCGAEGALLGGNIGPLLHEGTNREPEGIAQTDGVLEFLWVLDTRVRIVPFVRCDPGTQSHPRTSAGGHPGSTHDTRVWGERVRLGVARGAGRELTPPEAGQGPPCKGH